MLRAPIPAVAWFVITTLATWRAAGFIVFDEGPFRVGTRLRAAMTRLRLGALSRCFHCVSLWVSLAVVALAFEPSPRLVLEWWSVAGAASALELAVGGSRRRFVETVDEEPQELDHT